MFDLPSQERQQFKIKTILVWTALVAVVMVVASPWLRTLSVRQHVAMVALITSQAAIFFWARFLRARILGRSTKNAIKQAGDILSSLNSLTAAQQKVVRIKTSRWIYFSLIGIMLMQSLIIVVIAVESIDVFSAAWRQFPFLPLITLIFTSFVLGISSPESSLRNEILLCENGLLFIHSGTVRLVSWTEVTRAGSVVTGQLNIYQTNQVHSFSVTDEELAKVEVLFREKNVTWIE